MDFKLLYTEPALADLAEVMRWSWEKHPRTSERFGKAILDHINLLGDFPRLGRRLRGRVGLRQLLHSPLYIYYRVDESRKQVEVLRIRHTARRQPRL